MKKHFILVFLCLLVGGLSMTAQGRKDAVLLSAGYSIPSWSSGEHMDGGSIYLEAFHKFDVAIGYEKFLWRNLFVMPQVALWYSDNYQDYIYKGPVLVSPGTDYRPDLKWTGHKAWQFGGAFAVMGAWRVPLGQNFGFDFLTGPMLNLCFKSRVKGYGLEFDNLYRTATFDWRIGVALNIKSHLRLGVNLDLRPGNHKDVSTGEDHIYFDPSGEDRRNAWRFSVGYRF